MATPANATWLLDANTGPPRSAVIQLYTGVLPGLFVPVPVNQAGTSPTTVTLTASPNPSTLSQPVTLTATVNPAGSSGKVTFSFGTQLIGTAAVNSSGVATLTTTQLPTGTAPLRATYTGDGSHDASTSAPVSHTVRSLSSTGFVAPVASVSGVKTSSVATADFNSDGIPDMVLQSDQPYGVSVLLGNRNGTFARAQGGNYTPLTGSTLSKVTAADFNGDGFTDIAFAVASTTSRYDVVVLLGNGAGAFTAVSEASSVVCSIGGYGAAITGAVLAAIAPPGACQNPQGIAAADFNADGNADLAITNAGGNSVSILLGTGDGHFNPASGSPLAAGTTPGAVAIADLDGDGNADVIILNNGTVSMLRGDGHGGFAAISSLFSPIIGRDLAVADFNGDGILDVAVAEVIGSPVASFRIVLGGGQGLFSYGVSSPGLNAIAAADFNGDGKTDLALTLSSGAAEVWLGDGSGRFSRGSYPSLPSSGLATAVALDVNGDGRADLVGLPDNNSGGVLTLLALGPPASITPASGTPQTATVGTAFALPLKAKVVDVNNSPLPGVTVTFSAPQSGASAVLNPVTAITDSSGVATTNVTANTVAGAYAVSATVSGVTAPAQFQLTNTPGPPATIAPFSGNNQTAVVNTPFAAPLVALIIDAYGNPVLAGIAATFSVNAGTGPGVTLTPQTTSTDSAGRVTVAAVANAVAGGPYPVQVSAGTLNVAVFSLSNMNGSASGMSVVSGTPQSAVVSTPFGGPLVVVVRDSAGNAVPNAAVTFAGPQSGAGITPIVSTATTNSSGIATSPALASNGTAGSYTVTATVRIGETTVASVPFTLTNIAKLTMTSVCPGNIQAGASYLFPLSASGGLTPYTWQLTGALPSGIGINSVSGVIGGLTTLTGSYSIVIRVTDNGIGSLQQAASMSCTLTVATPPPPPLVISGCPAGPVTIGERYSYPLSASGGQGAKSWSADLPAGLSIDGSTVVGIPTGPAGTFTYNLVVTTNDQTASQQCTLVVNPPRLQLTSGCPAATGTVGASYGPFPLSATGGDGPSTYSYSIKDGSLPDGVDVKGGAIVGTPRTPGTFKFSIEVASGTQRAASSLCTVVIAAPQLEITGSCPATAQQVGTQVTASFKATGGQGPYTFTFSGLPEWLKAAGGGVSGTPPRGSEGTYSFTVSVRDNAGATKSKEPACEFTVSPGPPPATKPSINGACPATAQAFGASIALPFAATGGERPYTWSASGVAGLSFTASTGDSTTLRGSFNESGNYTLTIDLTDAAGQHAEPLTCPIQVGPPPPAIAPSTVCPSTAFDFGAQFSQTFAASGGTPPYSWDVTPSDVFTLSSRTGSATIASGTLVREGQITLTVRLTDNAGVAAPPYTCAVSVRQLVVPDISITLSSANLVDSTMTSSPLVDVTIRLASALPVPLTGRIGVTGPTAGTNLNRAGDATFTIPAGQTTQTEMIQLQRGTVAGTAQLTLTALTALGRQIDLPSPLPSTAYVVPAQPPSFIVTASQSAGGITIVVTGYSTTREIAGGTITFGAANDATIEGGNIDLAALNIAQIFASYFNSQSANNGSLFKLTIPVSIDGDVSAISTVTVTLRNSVGSYTAPAVPLR